MRILITGGTGYVSRNLVKKIRAYHELAILSRDSSLSIINDNDFYAGVKVYSYEMESLGEDVIETISLYDPDIVIHSAGYFSSSETIDDIKQLIEANIYFGSVILEVLSKRKSKRFINLSSSAQHFELEENKTAYSIYAVTKDSFEQILQYYQDRDNMHVINLTLQHVYGGDENKRIVFKIIHSIHKGKELHLTDGQQVFDFVHIDDVVTAIEFAIVELSNILQNKGFFLSYGVGTKVSTSLRSLVDVIRKYKEIPENILKWNKVEYRKFEFFKLWSNYTYISGWYPKINLEEGIRKTIKELEEGFNHQL
jgi:nucleoside-diphosphate-sugar epimerase